MKVVENDVAHLLYPVKFLISLTVFKIIEQNRYYVYIYEFVYSAINSGLPNTITVSKNTQKSVNAAN